MRRGSALLPALLAAFLACVRPAAALPPGAGRSSPFSAEEALSRGERLLAEKEFTAAEAALREAVRASPKSARALSGHALALLALHREEEGLAEARRAVALAPEDGNVEFRLGLALAENGRPGEAADAFERASRTLPKAVFPLRALAFARGDAGDERAADAFERLLRLAPDDVEARRRYAAYLWEGGKNERGDAVMEEAIRLAPDDASLHAELGAHLPSEGQFATAARELARARDLGLKTAVVLNQLGDAQWNSGALEDAAESFRQVIAANPANFVSQTEMGRLLVFRGFPGEAVPHLAKAAELAPGSVPIALDLGRARESNGDLAGAEAEYRRAVTLEPDLSKTHYALGLVLARRGAAEESRAELATAKAQYDAERARAFEKGSLRVESNLAWVELNRGEAAAALERFRRLSETAETLTGAGAALSRLGRHAEAVKALEKASVLAPDDRKIAARLSREYALAGGAR